MCANVSQETTFARMKPQTHCYFAGVIWGSVFVPPFLSPKQPIILPTPSSNYPAALKPLEHLRNTSQITKQQMLRHVLSRACPKSLLGLQPFGAAAALYSVQIVVPALGDSISDGAFCSRRAADACLGCQLTPRRCAGGSTHSQLQSPFPTHQTHQHTQTQHRHHRHRAQKGGRQRV